MNDTNIFELAQHAEELAKLKEENGILFYEPHPKQDRFHRKGAKLRRYVRTGNRFGKSTMGAAEDVAWALGYRPWYPEGDPARYEGIPRRSVKLLVICQDWDKVNEIFTNMEPGANQGKIFKLLPKDKIVGTPAKSKNGVVCLIKVKSTWGGTSAIYFDTVKSYMANPMGQESSDWDAIHVDEPCPQDMWNANSRGLVDRDGAAWFTCTPLSQMWINDMFVPRSRMREVLGDQEIDNGDYWMITGEMSDNPTLTPRAIEMFLSQLSPNERQCREKGLPLSLSGLIYKQFDYSSHVYDAPPLGWKQMWVPPPNYTIRMAVDPHPETPHAVLCAATSPTQEVFFFAEIFEQVMASVLAEKIQDILYAHDSEQEYYELAEAWMDPAGFIESPTDGSSMATEFDKHGIYCNRAVRDLARGIIVAQQGLGRMLTLPSGRKTPWLKFGQHLTRTLYEFDHYEWDSKKENKPIDKDDHMMENFYRLVVHGLHYIPPDKTGANKLIVKKRDYAHMSVPKVTKGPAPLNSRPRRYFSPSQFRR